MYKLISKKFSPKKINSNRLFWKSAMAILLFTLTLHQILWPTPGFASYSDGHSGAVPTVKYLGKALYDGMEIPDSAELTAHYEFNVYNDSFKEMTVHLPDPLVPAHTGEVHVIMHDSEGTYMEGGSVFVDTDGTIRFSINLTDSSDSEKNDIVNDIVPDLNEPDEETEDEDEKIDEETEDEEKNEDDKSGSEEAELDTTPPLMSGAIYTDQRPLEKITVSFEIPVVFDKDKIPAANDSLRQITVASGGQSVTVILVSETEPISFATLSVPTLVWEPISPRRPFGSAHNFGVFVFGDFTVISPNNYVHIEGGVAVQHDLALDRSHADFGQAHQTSGVGIQTGPHEPRLLIGHNLSVRDLYPSSPFMPSPDGYAVLLNNGNILMREGAPIASMHPIGVYYLDGRIPASFNYGLDNSGNFNYALLQSQVPRISGAVIDNFFYSARQDLQSLSSYYASVQTNTGERVFRGGTLNKDELIPLPPNPERFDTFVFDLKVTNGVIDAPVFNFPDGFKGNYVVNVPNNTSVRFSWDTSIQSPLGNPGIYQLARVYSHRIIWNFTGTGEITMLNQNNVSLELIGSILAVNSPFNAPQGGAVNGELIVGNFRHGGAGFEQHTTSFIQWGDDLSDITWNIPPISPPTITPEPPVPPTIPPVTITPEPPVPPTIPTDPLVPPTTPEPPVPPTVPTDPLVPPTTPEPPVPPTIPPEPPVPPTIPEIPVPPIGEIPVEPPVPPTGEVPPTEEPYEPITPTRPPVELPSEIGHDNIIRWDTVEWAVDKGIYIDGVRVVTLDLTTSEFDLSTLDIPQGSAVQIIAYEPNIPPRPNPQTGSSRTLLLTIPPLFLAVVSASIFYVVRNNYFKRERSYRAYLKRQRCLEDLTK